MAGKPRPRLIERLKPIEREITLERERRIKRRPRVPFGHNQLIPLGPIRLLRVDRHDPAVENGKRVHNAERAAHMPEAPRANTTYRFAPDFRGKFPNSM